MYWLIFLTLPLKQKAGFVCLFVCFSYKEEGIHDKAMGLTSLSLYTTSEHLIVLPCLNKMPLKQRHPTLCKGSVL